MELLSSNYDPDVRPLLDEAQRFLEGHSWCERVLTAEIGNVEPGIIGIFRVRLVPRTAGVPPELWVITGDLPSAYLVCDESPTWREALAAYIAEMYRWIHAVRSQEPVDQLIPVGVPPTEQYADMLEKRLLLLRQHLLDESLESGAA